MSDKKKYYITTPIYYPSDKLHIGHTYCTVMADAMARFKRLSGYDVRFLTGTDEHGQKIQTIAQEKGITPQQHVDNIVEGVKKLWETMEISYDDFLRTTEARHEERVQKIFMELYNKGDIYKDFYTGLYCKPCEAFWTESQLVDGKCPDCGRPVTEEHEEGYFFKLSKYQDQLIDLFENTEFLQPETRRNEMLSFVKQGLDDLCISRSSFDWGIKVPIDEKHVIYVWLDALSNYITALGYPDDRELYDKYWPADVHLVGKEIVRFHTVIWPAILMSLDLPLPKKVLGHGWLLLDGGKMSKSKGNVVDPVKLIDRYGIDALKYFLLREYTFGNDGNYSTESLIKRINSDLANDLGNLVSRTVSMIEKYNDGVVPDAKISDDFDADLKKAAVAAADKVEEEMDKFAFQNALEEIWVVVRRANKYIDEKMPWTLAKDEAQKDNLDTCLHNLAETIRIISILIYPFMHTTSDEIRKQMGLWYADVAWEDSKEFEMMYQEKVKKGKALFPRIDIEKELLELESLDKEESNEEKSIPLELKPVIDFEDFDKIDFRVGEIIQAEKHPQADKLLVFQVKMGTEKRQVISGVSEYFEPYEMVGKKIIVVANLKPRKLRGLESKGMIIFADNGERLELVTTEAPDGETVS
ncbi:methionine--tRNA ligase [Eubacteriales bacterium KG127]